MALVSTVWADFNLDGVVNENSGKPVAGALVSIVSVGPRAGKSAFSIWCHPDAGKHAITDAAGKFSLRGVDPIWIFTLAIEAKDHAPRELTADPRSTLPLRIRMLGENDLDTTGKVLLADGTPAAGAVVKIVSFETRGTHDLEDAFRATSVTTDEEGAFLIHSELLLSTIDVTVSYPDAVVNRVYRLAPSQKGQKLVLVPGTTLTGRVLTGARPAAGVPVRLTGLGGGTTLVEFAGNYDAVTDASGRFTFNHVYPLREFRLFTRMSEQGEVSGVAIPQTVLSGGTGKTLEVGELNLHPTHRVRGRVMLAGSGRHLPRMVVRLERLAAPDTREVEVDEKNSFSFEGVPAESVSLEFARTEDRPCAAIGWRPTTAAQYVAAH